MVRDAREYRNVRTIVFSGQKKELEKINRNSVVINCFAEQFKKDNPEVVEAVRPEKIGNDNKPNKINAYYIIIAKLLINLS